MPACTVRDFLVATKAKAAHAEPAITEFTDIVTDTRKITDGVLFVALKGERFNGEDFAAEAVEKGAKGVVVSTECPAEKYDKIAGADVFTVPDTLHAYQLAKRCNEKRTMYEAIRWGEHAQFITGSTFLVDGGAVYKEQRKPFGGEERIIGRLEHDGDGLVCRRNHSAERERKHKREEKSGDFFHRGLLFVR